MRAWFFHNWMNAGIVSALFLFALLPFVGGFTLPLVLIYLQLPVYLVHQLEEHHGDRFRRFVNDELAGGRDALTPLAVVVVNVGGVWLVNLIVINLARFTGPGVGLIAIYLTLVNALVHIAGAAVQRRYNPGLVTAIVLFLPAGLAAWWIVSSTPGVTITDQVIGLGFAVLIHVALIVHVRRRAAMLAAA